MDNVEKLFRYFGLHISENKTIRQISLETKIPYMTLNRIIKKLKKQNLILTKKHGKAIVCALNKNNTITKHHLILASEAFKNHFLEKNPLIKKMHEIIKENASKESSAILFGSYAKGKEQKYSDVDIAFISKSRRIIRKIGAEFRTIEQIHDVEINTVTFTEKQFKEMLEADEENVGKQIVKKHVVLHNPDIFWNLIYGALT